VGSSDSSAHDAVVAAVSHKSKKNKKKTNQNASFHANAIMSQDTCATTIMSRYAINSRTKFVEAHFLAFALLVCHSAFACLGVDRIRLELWRWLKNGREQEHHQKSICNFFL
jgi:hypothetical protein